MTRRVLALALLLPWLGVRDALAQRGTIETLLDGEAWKTDAGSHLLARDSGHFALEARLTAWGVLRVSRHLDLLGLGEAEAGKADRRDASWEYDQLEARLRFGTLQLDAGRVLMPIGLFGARRFSNVNPVIGAPDMYPTEYPWGAVVSGTASRFDWRVAAVSLPVVNTNYTPAPSGELRPLVGAGFSFGPALHLGAAVTRGSYLNRNAANLPQSWDSYHQTVASGDLRLSIGYVETRAELAWSSYDAPLASGPLHGLGAYAESKVTLSPRVFVGLRLEHFRYPFVINFPFAPFWASGMTTENNGEIGLGYRVSNALLIKTSFRKDQWPDPASPGFPTPAGYAAAVQVSWHAWPLEMFAARY